VDGGLAFQQFDLSHQHQGPELPVMDPHPGGAVFDEEAAVAAGEFRAKNIRIGDIVLPGAALLVGRPDIKMSAVVLIEERAEEEAAVKPGHTHPFDIRAGIDISQVGAIPDDTHVIFV
jgi:hypothetical protein